MDNPAAQIDETKLNALGSRIFGMWPTYKSDRRQIEERWLRNLRAMRKIHDPEVLAMIPSDRSKAYPGITQWIVRGTIARLMQLLFPMTDKNYQVKATSMPDLATEQLQQVLDRLVAETAGDGDPAQVQLTDEAIEKAVLEFAKGKAERMDLKVTDDLQEMDWVTLIRKLVKSAVGYNIGVLEGPLNLKRKSRIWERDQYTGRYTAVEVDKYKPLFENVPVWEYYPDLTAADIAHQDGYFRRRVMSRQEVQDLAARPDFLTDRINTYLREHQNGNYQALWWESAMKGEPKSGQASVSGKESRKFEVLFWVGGVTGRELQAAGNTVAEEDLGKMFPANVSMIDSLVIKCKVAPLGGEVNQHHVFIFEDDDLSILGNGQCDVVRDSQLSGGECVRAALDNMAVIGPMAEVNKDMLEPGTDIAIRKHKTWPRESQGGQSDAIPAVRSITVDSHLSELKVLIDFFISLAEKEGGLPPASVGDTTGGGSEALRTSKNASMFLGAAALPIRDTVRNYDTFTVSAISALVAWNTKYDPNPSRDGDHDVLARGSTSLIAKEVLSQALNEFRASVTPDEAPHLKPRAMLIARAKANDVPIDDLLEDEDKANQIIAAQQQQMQSQVQGQEELVKAQVSEMLARAFEHVAKAEAEKAGISLEVVTALIEGMKAGDKSATDHAKNLIAAHAADTSRIVANKPAPAKAAA